MKQSEYLRLCLEALKHAGWAVQSVDNGGDDPERVETIDEAMIEAQSVSECRIFFTKHNVNARVDAQYIVVIWQGPDATYQPAEEVISDSTIRVGEVLDTVAFMLERANG